MLGHKKYMIHVRLYSCHNICHNMSVLVREYHMYDVREGS